MSETSDVTYPLISVAVAVYKPDYAYFEKLLSSLNNQSYKNLEIIIRNDNNCPKEFAEVSALVKKTIQRFPFKILQNSANIGSIKTFEALTSDISGEFIAYCDQDDIWEAAKIEKLYYLIIQQNALLAYCNLSIINEHDEIVSNLTEYRKLSKPVSGDFLWKFFLKRNCIAGCVLLMEVNIAKQAIPFPNDGYSHDHWLALIVSTKGRIAYTPEPLIRYRIHGNNQTGFDKLTRIHSKEEYIQKRVILDKKRFEISMNTFTEQKEIRNYAEKLHKITMQRIRYLQKFSFINLIRFLPYIKQDLIRFGFELYLGIIPEKNVESYFKKVRKTNY
jgi:glycosyltransferase involved in cell wall biosynthesis